MKESTQKVVPASHTLNQKGRKKSINANEVPGSSFVSYDSNSAEDISFLTSSQSTLASDIVNVDKDEDGSSTGSKDVSIPPPYSTSRAVLEEEDKGSKVASASERDWSCDDCTYNHCGKEIEFLTCKMCGTARQSETQCLRAARRSNRIKL